MWAYRDYLRNLNRRLAKDYARENVQHVVVAIEEMVQAAPGTLALAGFTGLPIHLLRTITYSILL